MSTQSNLLQVGRHCSLESCSVQDFLPFQCECSLVFCRDHIFPDTHSCAAVKPALTIEEAESKGSLRKCDFDGCSKPTLYAFSSHPDKDTCDTCKGSHCVLHRHPDTHGCSPVLDYSASTPRPSDAQKLLEKNFGSALSNPSTSRSSSSRNSKKKRIPTDPLKLAQYKKIELMKMRSKATPADPKDKATSVPADQRLTVNVRYGQTEKALWLRKSVSGGRAIDLLSAQLQVDPSLKTRLCRINEATEEEETLKNDTGLGEQVEDGMTLTLVHDP